MSAQVIQPQKQDSGIGKLAQVFQMGMQAKNAFGGKGQAAQPVETDPMKRRMSIMMQQKAAGEQGPY